jgi:hypothetical protein
MLKLLIIGQMETKGTRHGVAFPPKPLDAHGLTSIPPLIKGV